MIKKVRVTKDAFKTVEVFYNSGKVSTYAFYRMPQTAIDFILEVSTKVHENDYFTWYEK